MEPDCWDDDEYGEQDFIQPGVCACGSEFFIFVLNSGERPVFTIDEFGLPVDVSGHPRCASCDLDYPVVFEDFETGEIEIYFSDDID